MTFEWVWFESPICWWWLQWQLGEVYSIKTKGSGEYAMFSGPISLKWPLENLFQWLIGLKYYVTWWMGFIQHKPTSMQEHLQLPWVPGPFTTTKSSVSEQRCELHSGNLWEEAQGNCNDLVCVWWCQYPSQMNAAACVLVSFYTPVLPQKSVTMISLKSQSIAASMCTQMRFTVTFVKYIDMENMDVWKLPNWCTNFEKEQILTNIPTVQYSTKDPSGTLHEPNFPTIVCSYLASGYCCLLVVGLFQPCWDDTPKEIMCLLMNVLTRTGSTKPGL